MMSFRGRHHDHALFMKKYAIPIEEATD